MRLRLVAKVLALTPLLLPRILLSEVPTAIDPDAAALHLKASTPPVYPPSALAAHITGTVVLSVTIDASGFVTQAKAISGPSQLQSAATEAAKLRVYEPFVENGNAVTATTTVSIPFAAPVAADPNDVSSETLFVPLAHACHAAVSKSLPAVQQIAVCRKAANLADALPPDDDSIDRYNAYVFAAEAYNHNRLFQVAVIYADRAIRITEQKHYEDPGISAVYVVRAEAELGLGNLLDSDRDLEKAEHTQRAAISTMKAKGSTKQTSQNLKALLIFHAQVLSALHKPLDAQAKTQEAASL
jgi:TonB family protein